MGPSGSRALLFIQFLPISSHPLLLGMIGGMGITDATVVTVDCSCSQLARLDGESTNMADFGQTRRPTHTRLQYERRPSREGGE